VPYSNGRHDGGASRKAQVHIDLGCFRTLANFDDYAGHAARSIHRRFAERERSEIDSKRTKCLAAPKVASRTNTAQGRAGQRRPDSLAADPAISYSPRRSDSSAFFAAVPVGSAAPYANASLRLGRGQSNLRPLDCAGLWALGLLRASELLARQRTVRGRRWAGTEIRRS
jgi:hypothetical protein